MSFLNDKRPHTSRYYTQWLRLMTRYNTSQKHSHTITRHKSCIKTAISSINTTWAYAIFHTKYLKVNTSIFVFKKYIDAHTTRENNIYQNNAQIMNDKTRRNTRRRPSLKSRENHREITTLYHITASALSFMKFTDITRTCITHSARLVCLETQPSSDT